MKKSKQLDKDETIKALKDGLKDAMRGTALHLDIINELTQLLDGAGMKEEAREAVRRAINRSVEREENGDD